MSRHILLITALTFILSACQTPEKKAGVILYESVLINKQKPLIDTMSQMLNGINITLAADAFMSSSELTIERHKMPGSGRDYSTPDHFRLWVQGETCILEYVESGKFATIADLKCVEASN